MGNSACCNTPLEKAYQFDADSLMLKRAPTSTDMDKLVDKFYSSLEGQISPQSSIYGNILKPSYLQEYTQMLRNNYVQHWHAQRVLSLVLKYMQCAREYAASKGEVKPDQYAQMVTDMGSKFKRIKDQVFKLTDRFETIVRRIGCEERDGEMRAKEKAFADYSFDLSLTEVEDVLQLAQKSAIDDPRAFCILTNYLVKSCLAMQDGGKNIPQIQQKYRGALSFLQQKLDTQKREFDGKVSQRSVHPSWKNFEASPQLILDLTNIASYQKSKQIEAYFEEMEEATIKNYPLLYSLIDEYDFKRVGFTVELRKLQRQKKNNSSIVFSLFTQTPTRKLKEQTYAQVAKSHDFDSLCAYEKHHHDQQTLQAVKNTYKQVDFSKVPMITVKCCFDRVAEINALCKRVIDRIHDDTKDKFKLMEIKNELNYEAKDPKLSMIVLLGNKTVIQIDILLYKDRDEDFEEKFHQLNNFEQYSPLTALKTMNQELSSDLFGEMRQFFKEKHGNLQFDQLKAGFDAILEAFNIDTKLEGDSHPYSVDGILLVPLHQEFLLLKEGKVEESRQKDDAVFKWSNHKYRMAMGYNQDIMEEWNHLKRQAGPGNSQNESNLILNEEQAVLQGQFASFGKESLVYQVLYLSDLGLINQSYDPEKSIRYYRQCLNREQALHTKKTPFYTDLLNRIGRVHYSQDRQQTALQYYELNLANEQTMGAASSSDYAITLSNIATIHYNNKNDKQALKYYEQALKIQAELPQQQTVEDATVLSNIGSLYYSQGNQKKSLQYFIRSLRVAEKNSQQATLTYASTLSNLGAISFSRKDYPAALQYYQQCRDAEQRMKLRNGEDQSGPSTRSSTYRNISRCYLKMGQKQEAEEYGRKSELMQSEVSSFH